MTLLSFTTERGRMTHQDAGTSRWGGQKSRSVPPHASTAGWQLPDWSRSAPCRGMEESAFFPEQGPVTKAALSTCEACPVRAQCLEAALSSPWMPYGPWGGLRQHEVQALWSELNDPAARRADLETFHRVDLRLQGAVS